MANGIRLKLKDVMTTNPACCEPATTLVAVHAC